MRAASTLFLLLLCLAPLRADDAFQKSLENPRVQTAALKLARQTLAHFFDSKKVLALPEKFLGNLPDALKQTFSRRAGVIVTIEKKGRIAPRGCRGTLQPVRENLAQEIIFNALAAATRDAREKPLRKDELKDCRISLTVIVSIKPIQNLSQHDAARCGLVAQSGNKIGLVLPYEGRDALTQWKWARAKAGLKDNQSAQMLEVEAVRFREP